MLCSSARGITGLSQINLEYLSSLLFHFQHMLHRNRNPCLSNRGTSWSPSTNQRFTIPPLRQAERPRVTQRTRARLAGLLSLHPLGHLPSIRTGCGRVLLASESPYEYLGVPTNWKTAALELSAADQEGGPWSGWDVVKSSLTWRADAEGEMWRGSQTESECGHD